MWTNLGHLITVILQQEDCHSCTGLDPRVPWSIVAAQVVVIMLFISIMIIITIMISSYPGYFEHSLQPGCGTLHHLELRGLLSSARGSDNNVLQRII